ncbi:hypothetical protein [Sulfitobacter sabulilitoris]|uniref:DUF2867 domain-containing protein n=1 Tax=Sulfitobacter sabulilitoris TaxID=2562655 RepID=A0A5S3PR20_9RHOB|nr:hypothetical protein [Sulfitobacter sabulilitoris]TMM54995.1 hypothetical protein FDT80_05325 [Sulfitobacter sabulilitoris]
MMGIEAKEVPHTALLARYVQRPGCYTDAFMCRVRGDISLARFVAAFYTTPLFRLERGVLRVLLARRSTDRQAHALGAGDADSFAVWWMEARTADQLLLCDLSGRTRSWFMVVPRDGATQLWFGSAVVPPGAGIGTPTALARSPQRSRVLALLLAPHRIYSRALLASAARRINAPG